MSIDTKTILQLSLAALPALIITLVWHGLLSKYTGTKSKGSPQSLATSRGVMYTVCTMLLLIAIAHGLSIYIRRPLLSKVGVAYGAGQALMLGGIFTLPSLGIQAINSGKTFGQYLAQAAYQLCIYAAIGAVLFVLQVNS
jgi:hypothetical protein